MSIPIALTVKPRPIDGESADAYLTRLFDINGEPWGRDRLRALGLKLSDIVQGQTDRAFHVLLKDESGPLSRFTPSRMTKKCVIINGEELHRDDWTTYLRRWCPACWADDLKQEDTRHRHWNIHRRFWWDVAAVRTCPIHFVRLESQCPCSNCGVTITSEGRWLTRCINLHSLLRVDPVAVAPQHTVADAYVVGRLGGTPRISVPLLDSVTLREALDLMERFGVSKLGGAYGSLSKFDVDRHPEIMSTGLEIARGWPNSFQALLEDLGATSGLGQWGIEQVYGYLYLWVKALPDNPFGQTVRSEMFSYIAQGRFVHGRSIVAGYASNDTMTVAEAADFCGLGSATISRYLRALGQFPQRTKRGSPILVERRIVEDLKAQLDGTFQLGDLPSILALDPTQVKALIKAGLIKPMELATKAGKARRLFEREHIETVLMRLRGEAPVLEAIPSELKPLAHSCRHAKLGGLPVACRLILEGKVRVQAVLRSAIGLAGLFIDPDDLRKVRRAEAGAALHVRDAARILGLHQETIWSLVHQGLLPAVKLDSQRYGIALLDVKEFDRQYVSATAIARDLATLPRYLNPALHLIGINPALSSQKDGRCRVSIYRRTELPEDLPAWWATFQNDSK